MKIVVVYNPKSGSALPKRELKKLFNKADLDVLQFIDVTKDFDKTIKPYINKRSVIIAGYGGDGTLNSVATKLHGTTSVFAPLPGGTLNHFTKDLGVNQDLEVAILKLPKAKKRQVDTASVNGELFLNNSSIGLYPSSLAVRSKTEDKLGKWPAALYASIRALIRFKLYTVKIGNKTYTTPFIFVGNNHYDANSLLARKSINKGKLSVHMVHTGSRWPLIKIVVLALIGKVTQVDEFVSSDTNSVQLNVRKKRVRVSFDGEHALLDPPITYKIHKQSLTVMY